MVWEQVALAMQKGWSKFAKNKKNNLYFYFFDILFTVEYIGFYEGKYKINQKTND